MASGASETAGGAASLRVRRIGLPRLGVGGAPSTALRAATAVLALLLAVLVVGTAFAAGTRGRVLPEVSAGGVPLGGLDQAAARDRLQSRVAELSRRPLALTAGGRSWTPLPADLGMIYDVEASVAAAMAFGRDHHQRDGLFRAVRLKRDPAAVPLAVRFDKPAFDAYLDHLDAEIGSTPVDASVAVAGTDVSVTPARDGLAVDRAALGSFLVDRPAGAGAAALDLPLRPAAAAVGDDQARAVKAQLDRAFAASVVLSLDDREWQIAPDELAGMVRVDTIERDGRRSLVADLDEAALRARVAALASEVDVETADARVEDLGTHHRLVPATHGRALHQDDLIGALRAAFAAGEHAVPVPVEPGPTGPAVTTEALLADLGATDPLAVGDSDFAGSVPERATNVRLAVERVDGTMIPPGGVFSYNAVLGSLFDSAFVEADAMIEGGNGVAEGGGVCQVSTTLFRAALRSGLPIVEWWPHRYRSPVYEQGGWSAGFDAAIVQVEFDPEGSTDFRFENPTDGWLLVRANVVGETGVQVELLGTDPGYEVEIDGPWQETLEAAPDTVNDTLDPALPPGTAIEERPAAAGERFAIVRRVYNADGTEIATDEFVSPYGGRGALRRVSLDLAQES